jgi:hypothetical protein
LHPSCLPLLGLLGRLLLLLLLLLLRAEGSQSLCRCLAAANQKVLLAAVYF